MPLFLVPDDLRAFLRTVVDHLDGPATAIVLDAEDAFQAACGHGGRIAGTSIYRFSYLTADGAQRWTIVLHELELRAIVDGLQIEVDGEVVRTGLRQPSGDPLLVWGAYNDDALIVHSHDDLAAALDTLRRYALDKPRVVRMWSSSDDQLIAVIWGGACALYVLESADGYATSSGDPRRSDAFEVLDHDGNSLIVPRADCVPWPAARAALLHFAAHGDLGPEIVVERRIPSQLLMHGELDRQAVLATRALPSRDPRQSSLPRLTPLPLPAILGPPGELAADPPTDVAMPAMREPATPAELSAWSYRLIELLSARGLVELDPRHRLDEISYQLSGLLQAHGDEAEHSLDTAEWLANEIGTIRGIVQLFATAGDLQLALRRSRAGE
jgi:hypothetical protein